MPRDLTRRSSGPELRRRAASPVSALSAFSALVVVSVAISSGLPPEAGAEPSPAFGAASGQRASDGWTLLAAGSDRPWAAPVPLHAGRSASSVRDGAEGDGGRRQGAGRGDSGGPSASTVRPGRQAPRLYEGELPVNTLIAPTSPGVVLSGGQFGWRIAPDRGGREFHNGTDISADAGLPVVAALDGVVTDVFWDVWGGNRVEVAHENGMRTTYNHLEDVSVRVGDRLAASEELGSVGATGTRVTGPHLHFETWVDGKAVDPQSFDWIDGFRVIPASRAKYSLEVLVPGEDGPAAAAEPASGPVAEAGKQVAKHPKAQGQEPAPNAPAPPARAEPVPARTSTGSDADTDTDEEEPGRGSTPGPASEPAATESPAAPATELPAAPGTEPPAAPDTAPAPVHVPDTQRDLDGDGTLDVVDPDLDGDGIANEADDDLDGDGIANEVDDDLDGDGLLNGPDPDADGDGRPDTVDARPGVPDPILVADPSPAPSPPSAPPPAPDGTPGPMQSPPPAPGGAPAPAPGPTAPPGSAQAPIQAPAPTTAPTASPAQSRAPAPTRPPVPTTAPTKASAPTPSVPPGQAPAATTAPAA